ncbi:hypothetical protein ACIP46_02765 [Streptomyces lavendulae]|uniref:hypothetical protein n=1 Tax=Streptomyces lavendulae TaxID=1914 RepID=UPI0038048E98
MDDSVDVTGETRSWPNCVIFVATGATALPPTLLRAPIHWDCPKVTSPSAVLPAQDQNSLLFHP